LPDNRWNGAPVIYSIIPRPSSDELKLIVLMRRDCEVLSARARGDETATPAPKRSPETRAKIAAKMRGNQNRKSKPDVPPSNRRAAYG
jgi:hypothetical protein